MTMKSRAYRPRWRPMKTAPKDGTYILLAYPSFSDSGEVFVGHSRWVDMPHHAQVEAYTAAQHRDPPDLGVPHPVANPHWECSYVAVWHHGGRHYNGYSYGPQSVTIRHPLGWLPVPLPPSCSLTR